MQRQKQISRLDSYVIAYLL